MQQRRCRYYPTSLGLRAASFLTITITSLPLEKSWQKGNQNECKSFTLMFDADVDTVVPLRHAYSAPSKTVLGIMVLVVCAPGPQIDMSMVVCAAIVLSGTMSLATWT